MANGNQLPEGFVLDQPQSGLPEGFVLDTPVQTVQETLPDPGGFRDAEGNILAPDAVGQPIPAENDFPFQDIIEPALTIASGAIAEPVAGAVGLTNIPFIGADNASDLVESIREAMTFIPRGSKSLKNLQSIADALEPVTKAIETVEDASGEAGFKTGGPIGGALGQATPTAALSALGLGGVRRALGIKTPDVTTGISTAGAKKLLKESAPTIDGLKDAARGVYKEIDDLGAVVSSKRVNTLSNELQAIARKEGFNRKIHPKVNAALDEFRGVKNSDQKVTDIDILRKVAKNAADSIDPSEKRLGMLLVNKIDDTLDNLKPKDFKRGGGEVGAKYRDARQLWARAKKSELLDEAFSKASLQASGFENGIRVQFRSILNSKKKLNGFNKEEIRAMKDVVKGGSIENIAKMLGRFGFSEGQASNMLMGSLGVAGGAALGGAPGAVAVPLIGQLSRSLAQKLTRKGADDVDTLVRAGNNSDDIVKAYMRIVPKKERNPSELAELLLRPEISLTDLKSTIKMMPKERRKIVSDAVFIADLAQQQKNQPQ